MTCPCKKRKAKEQKMEEEQVSNVENGRKEPRTGVCPACLRKHLLKALGYAEEVAEDATREWERDRMLMNLMLAEDHCAARGDESLRATIRDARIKIEDGADPVPLAKGLVDTVGTRRTVLAMAKIVKR